MKSIKISLSQDEYNVVTDALRSYFGSMSEQAKHTPSSKIRTAILDECDTVTKVQKKFLTGLEKSAK